MPSSRPEPLPYICNRIILLKPKSVLDIGIGFGKYGFLAREYTDIWRTNKPYEEWNCRIDGIEVYENYIGRLQREIYSNIFIGHVNHLLPKINFDYDLIIMSDVLEHLKVDEGVRTLSLIKKYGKVGLVITPANVLPQGSVYNNIYETHVSAWNEEKLKEWGQVFKFGNAYILEM